MNSVSRRRTSADLDIKLIENNARVGADVAVELARIQKDSSSHASSSAYLGVDIPTNLAKGGSSKSSNTTDQALSSKPVPRVVVIGSAAMDLTSHSSLPLSPRSTTPGSICLTPGGVGRNVAEAAQNLLAKDEVMLVSALGAEDQLTDAVGRMLLSEMEVAGMRTDGLGTMEGERTAACTLVLEGNMDLVNGVADMGIIEKLSPDTVGDWCRLADDRSNL